MKRNRLVDQLNDRPSTPAAEYWRDQPGNQARLAYRDRLACWLLRILCSAGVMPTAADANPPRHAAFAELLGVPELADPAASPLAVSQAVSAALLRLADPVQLSCTPTRPGLRHAAHLELAGARSRPGRAGARHPRIFAGPTDWVQVDR